MNSEAWNFADAWEAIAARFGDQPALIEPGRTLSWAELDRRADAVAQGLLDAGLGAQAKVAQYLYNAPEYLESVFACFKAGLVPVNTNYRYTGDELAYLWDNADVEAVVFHSDLAERCDELRKRLPHIRMWLWVDAGTGECPAWAVPYEELAQNAVPERPTRGPWGRSGDDLFLLYTGGTTGYPKGVMWTQDTMYRMLEELNGRTPSAQANPVEVAQSLSRPGPRVLAAPPLMHGTAIWFAMPALNQGGSVVTLPDRSFDPARLLDALVNHEVKGICIVGDAFARPLADALDAEPERWDLSGLRVIFSSGVMFSPQSKARLLRHARRATIVDSLGSSESGGVGRSLSGAGDEPEVASFKVGDRTRVVDEEGRDVVPGSGQRGRLAIAGHIPSGYYGDPVKTAETFVEIDGVVHVVAGDWAEVEADGTIRLLGRGSASINTGGEKVYPEEVEEVIKALPGVRDAVVVGVPDDRFGEAVAALVEPDSDTEIDGPALTESLRDRLAGYKLPRHLVFGSIGRAPNGKADYAAVRERVQADLARPS